MTRAAALVALVAGAEVCVCVCALLLNSENIWDEGNVIHQTR